MSLRNKLIIYVVIATVVTAFAILFHYFKQREVFELYVNKVIEQKELLFTTATDLKGDPFRKVLVENSIWDDMVNFVKTKDAKWAKENINTFLDIHKANSVWIYDTNEVLIYSIHNLGDTIYKRMPAPSGGIRKLFINEKFPHFYIYTNKGLIEIFGASIHPSNDFDRITPPVGYFFVSKLWDKNYEEQIEKIIEANIDIYPHITDTTKLNTDTTISFIKGINDFWTNKGIASIVVSKNISTLKDMEELSRKNFNNVLIFFFLFLVISAFLFRRWIIVPINNIGLSFKNENADNLKYLEKGKDELSIIARTIDGFFKQKAEIEENRKKFKDMFDNHSAVMLLVDPVTDDIIDANVAAEKYYGYTYDVIIKMKISEINVLAEEKLKKVIYRAINNTQNYFIFKHKISSGSIRDVEVYSTPIISNNKTILFSIIHDITERRRIEEALLISESRLRRIFEEAPLGIIQGAKGKRRVNKAFTDITGYSESEYINMSPLEITNAEDLEIEDKLYKEMYSGRRSRFEVQQRIYHKEGKLIWINLIAVAVRNMDNEIIDEIAIIEDISERKRAEEALNDAKEAAEAAGRSKSIFLSNLSHEIRNPLNAIMGLTDILLTKDFQRKEIENLNAIRFSADNLLGIVSDILDFSKIESGKLEFDSVDFDIRSSIRNINNSIAPTAEKKDLILRKYIDDNIPQIVRGDSLRFNQILGNLIGNAVKFTDTGYIDTSVKLLKETEKDVTLLIEIKDTGIGIPKEKLGIIFESFTQAYADTTRRFGGSGLGLTITKRLVELQGGSISVESKLGEGSVFKVTLNYEKSDADFIPQEIKEEIDSSQLTGKKVLVIEDNIINQFLFKKILNEWGMIVDLSNSGADAIGKLRVNEYDVVVTDIQMPEMSGYEIAQYIRNPNSEVSNHNVPIIAITAASSEGIIERVSSSGMNGVLFKPVDRERTLELIYLSLNGKL